MQKISICMVSDDFLPAMTGVGMHVQLVAAELVRQGHAVSIITTRRKGEPELEIWKGVKVYRILTIKVYGFYQGIPSKSTIRTLLNLIKPDLIHHHYIGFMFTQVFAIATSLSIPQIATYHFKAIVLTQTMFMRPFRGFIHFLMIRYYNRCKVIIVPSKNVAKEVCGEGVDVPVHYITNPLVFNDSTDVTPVSRRANFTILYAGRLAPEKNIGYLIKAFALLEKKFPDTILLIAGSGSEDSKLKSLVKKLSLGDKVTFLGFLTSDNLARYYASCDVFVLPSLVETLSLVAIEAMSFGCPIIVTKAIVSKEEFVDHGENGYIVDQDSVEDLTEKLFMLAQDPLLRRAQGANSKSRVHLYRLEPIVDALEMLYYDILSK